MRAWASPSATANVTPRSAFTAPRDLRRCVKWRRVEDAVEVTPGQDYTSWPGRNVIVYNAPMLNLIRSAAALACAVLLGATVTHTTTKVMFQGKPVELVTLKNKNGMEVQAISYGGIITSLKVPDRAGALGDVVLGFDQSNQYFADPPPPFFCAIVGRYGDRIAKGEFALDLKKYVLAKNNPPNHLHGGNKGFDKVLR